MIRCCSMTAAKTNKKKTMNCMNVSIEIEMKQKFSFIIIVGERLMLCVWKMLLAVIAEFK